MKKVKVPGVANLHSVMYDKNTDDVFVTFKVVSDEYKEYVMRLANRDDINLVVRGEQLDLSIGEE